FEFIKSSRGTNVLLYNRYTYARNNASRAGVSYACSSRSSKKCGAQVFLTNEGVISVVKEQHSHEPPRFYIIKVVTAVDGATLLMLDGYVFTNPSPMSGGERWYCSGRVKWKCAVCLHVNDDYELVCISHKHGHEPPVYEITPRLREFDNGRKRYCLGGYTFYKHKPILRGDASRWLCTRRQCPVYLHLDSDLNLLYRPSREHPHPPVCIYRNASGRVDEATTSTSTGLRGPRRKTAQYYRDYRARKRAEQEKESLYRTSDPSTTADSFRKKRKSAAEYQREYRARQKAKRNNMLIDSLAVLPSTSTGGLTSTHQSTTVGQLTTTGYGGDSVEREHVPHNWWPHLQERDESETFTAEYLEDDANEGIAMFLETSKGRTVLQYDGYRYRKAYRSKNGTRWNCTSKNCSAFVYLNDQDEIIMTSKFHDHQRWNSIAESVDPDLSNTAVVITSRKGKEMLLFRQYTYRKQYDTGLKTRWVCSTLKNCRACVFTDSNNLITSAFEEHEHDPPKYYLNPSHILEALREPIVFESD
ncbi:modifier of mdg4, partial [Danaus plexippus plexippus]